jgi:hypothetical protein
LWSRQPRLLLTGHSKGGGQAQDAATKQKLEAVVFNSDLVNPIIFSDWMLEPPWYLEPFIEAIRAFYSLRACVLGDHDDDVQQYIEYFATGRIRDVRMVNDPLTRVLFLACQNNLPHASIEWLSDTLTCSSNGLLAGHMIDNVARELQACTQTNIVDPVKKKP